MALAQQAEPAAPTIRFSIPAQPLAGAVDVFSRASGWQVGYSSQIAQTRTRPVSGAMAPREALQAMLAGTGISVRYTGPRSAALVEATAASAGDGGAEPGTIALDTISVEGENAWGPVDGYVATRSATATRTDTPLIETPRSVSVVTADQITDQKAVSVSDALVYTPGVVSQSQSFSRMVDDVMIRGFNAAAAYGSFLRDGMKLQSNVYDGGQEPYGLERLEVLRGASSMLYGQLAPGGIINAISKRPTEQPLHEVNLEYGSYDRKQISADFGGPLTQDGTLLYRLTGLYRDAGNWVDDTPDDKVYIAPAITWAPNDSTSLTVLASYQHVNTRFSTPLLYEDVVSGTIPRNLFLGVPDFDRYESDMYTLGYLFEHEFDNGLKLRSKARYYQADVQWDYMQANFLPVTDGQLYRRASVRDEVSYGVTADNSLEKTFAVGAVEHNVLAGFDYYRRGYDSHRYRGTTFVPLDIDDPIYAGPGPIDPTDRGSDAVGDQYGIYLQDQVKWDRWVLLLGGRYDWTESTTTAYQTGAVTEQKDDAPTGQAGLLYLFDNGLAPYVSVSTSFSAQPGVNYLTPNLDPLKPNKGLQYEAGVRYQPDGSILLLSAAVYQLTQTNVVSYTATGLSYQVGEVRSRGIELEARAQFEDFGLIGAYAYTDAEILDSAVESQIGQQVELVPRNTFALWADYKLSLGLRGLTVGAGVRYIGETNMLDVEPDVPGYTLVDAMLRYDLGALDRRLDGTTLTVNARNLFDKQYFTCAGSTGCRYGEPATVTATLTYKW
ncbi:TonB-dependent siderophore receptor [Starkeya sp. ORNL1]|uniref:TonB-dependent siderophore receptor n=1 Tax=Starkeya sp. ORNL1 TaxID=2709380 RepID=UPI001462D8D8|nr:TonB-dependent siderophore receptor [Starkeya sp. ORNL1]QJP16866.1 TonB-dependent siderophore receptor [Starkeya sp. ORNL1]